MDCRVTAWLLFYCTESCSSEQWTALEKGTKLEKFEKEDEMMKLYELHMAFLEKWKAAVSPEAALEAIGDTKVGPASLKASLFHPWFLLEYSFEVYHPSPFGSVPGAVSVVCMYGGYLRSSYAVISYPNQTLCKLITVCSILNTFAMLMLLVWERGCLAYAHTGRPFV